MRDPRDCGSLVGACASRWLAGDHVSRGSPWGAWVAIADPWCFGSPMGLWWATLVCFDRFNSYKKHLKSFLLAQYVP